MGTELELDNIIEFEKEIDKSITLLYYWLDDELKLQPRQLKNKILEGCNKLSMNYDKRGGI